MKTHQRTVTLGVIIGNRSFFPGHLCETGRMKMLKVLQEEGINAVILDQDATAYGAVESHDDAVKCANLFKENRDRLDGILVTLPNFGDEKAIAHAIRYADLRIPVLVHAFNDDIESMTIRDRRDSFCGKISVCNNLKQFGIPYSLTSLHTVDPASDCFRTDLRSFVSVCRVTRSLRNVRFGAIGARTAAFNTVRYSEKLLEQSGISVEPLDLSELFSWTKRTLDSDIQVKRKLDELKAYVNTQGVPEERLVLMAKLGTVIESWMEANGLSATAIQCWTSMQELMGISPCTIMSMMSHAFMPSACEVDVAGLVGMYALQEAANSPSAILDWNNNYGDDPDKAVVFHCSNLPKNFFEHFSMDKHEILSHTLGGLNCCGTLTGRIKASPFTFLRVSTDDLNGGISAYVGEGSFTKDSLDTFGGYGVVYIKRFQQLLQLICEQGFEHHVSTTLATVAPAIQEAFSKYMGWKVHYHQ